MSGSWGQHSPPLILGMIGRDTGQAPGLNGNGSILILFDKRTNEPAISTMQEILSVFNFFLAYIGVLQGAWLNMSAADFTVL